MTKRKINKAIAEFCEWKELSFHLDGNNIIGDRPKFIKGKIVSYTVDQYVPDYCNDLNEMHEVMKSLSDEQVEKVWETLCDMIPNNPKCYRNGLVFDAPAIQRAEAFLRVIGKWEE